MESVKWWKGGVWEGKKGHMIGSLSLLEKWEQAYAPAMEPTADLSNHCSRFQLGELMSLWSYLEDCG